MSKLWKKCLLPAMNSCFYGMSVTLVIYLIIIAFKGDFVPMLPEFVSHFNNTMTAMLVQILLIGVMSAVFGGGSYILELERVPLLVQSILYFVLTTAIWFPIANFCWSVTKYPTALIGIGSSYLLSYAISWIVQYRICKKNVAEINIQLERLKNETHRHIK